MVLPKRCSFVATLPTSCNASDNVYGLSRFALNRGSNNRSKKLRLVFFPPIKCMELMVTGNVELLPSFFQSAGDSFPLGIDIPVHPISPVLFGPVSETSPLPLSHALHLLLGRPSLELRRPIDPVIIALPRSEVRYTGRDQALTFSSASLGDAIANSLSSTSPSRLSFHLNFLVLHAY